MPTNHKNMSAATKSDQYGMYSADIQSMMQELLHTLANIDFQHDSELDKLERSSTDEELKRYIKDKIRARHRERREPYLDLLAELRHRQHSLSFAS